MESSNRWAWRLVLEGIVVVGSILIAFVLDAWWEERALQADLRGELSSVGQEVAGNQDLVAFEITRLERAITAAEVTVDRLYARRESPTALIPDSILWQVAFASPTLELSLGALDALVASGRLAQIEDDELKRGLAGLRGRLSDAVGDELLAQEILMESIFPALAEETDFSNVYLFEKARFSEPRDPEEIALLSEGVTAIPNTQGLRNHILNRASWMGAGLNELRRFDSFLDSVRVRISQANRE